MTGNNGNQTDEEFTSMGPYTRRKVKVQLGDGPDQRGEVTLEAVREYEEESGDADDAGFAEWSLEVDRSVRVLRDQLGLRPEEDA